MQPSLRDGEDKQKKSTDIYTIYKITPSVIHFVNLHTKVFTDIKKRKKTKQQLKVTDIYTLIRKYMII